MERLTYFTDNNNNYCCQVKGADNAPCRDVCDSQIGCKGCPIDIAMRRLAAYEDTGLTPEEIMDGKMLTGWIPVEERMPEGDELVLVTRLKKNVCCQLIGHIVTTVFGMVEVQCPMSLHGCHCRNRIIR